MAYPYADHCNGQREPLESLWTWERLLAPGIERRGGFDHDPVALVALAIAFIVVVLGDGEEIETGLAGHPVSVGGLALVVAVRFVDVELTEANLLCLRVGRVTQAGDKGGSKKVPVRRMANSTLCAIY